MGKKFRYTYDEYGDRVRIRYWVFLSLTILSAAAMVAFGILFAKKVGDSWNLWVVPLCLCIAPLVGFGAATYVYSKTHRKFRAKKQARASIGYKEYIDEKTITKLRNKLN